MSTRHEELKSRALASMPAGVNSPVRAFRSVGGDPIFVKEAKGARLITEDGRELIDFCMSFGPLVLGHAHPAVVEAIRRAAEQGTSYAVTTEAEIALAELIQSAIPSMERLRLVSSGTEACMTAIRLARGATGREKILKFSGCYHGHADCLLVQAGSGVAGIACASSAGVPEGCAGCMMVAPYNSREHVERIMAEEGSEIAAIIVEPVAANMGLVHPDEGFLQFLRVITAKYGSLLIFDEVTTGFRFAFGGYQNVSGVTPDLTCLGKAIGGGMPIGAVGGKLDVMECIAPIGSVYQAGTLSGNPISVASGLATLKTLRDQDPYPMLETRAQHLVQDLEGRAEAKGIPLCLPTLGSLFCFFFSESQPHSFDEVMAVDSEPFKRFFHACLERGVYLAPSAFEAAFLSIAHDDVLLDEAVGIFSEALKAV